MNPKKKQMRKLIALIFAIAFVATLIILMLVKWAGSNGTSSDSKFEEKFEAAKAELTKLREINYKLAEGMKGAIENATDIANEIYGLSEGYVDKNLLAEMRAKYETIEGYKERVHVHGPNMDAGKLKELVDSTLNNFNQFLQLSDKIEDESIRTAIEEYENSLDGKVSELVDMQRQFTEQIEEIREVKAERDEYERLYKETDRVKDAIKRDLDAKSEELEEAKAELSRIAGQVQRGVGDTTSVNVDEMSDDEIYSWLQKEEVQKLIEEKELFGSGIDQTQVTKLINDISRLKKDSADLAKIIEGKDEEIEKLLREVFDERRKISQINVFYWEENSENSQVPLKDDTSPRAVRKFFNRKKDVIVDFKLGRANFLQGQMSKKVTLKLSSQSGTELTSISETVSKRATNNGNEPFCATIRIPHKIFAPDKKRIKSGPVIYDIQLIDDDGIELLKEPYTFKLRK